MRVNHDPAAPACPAGKPCIRDMHELLRDHLPPSLIKLTSWKQLRRRAQEIATEHPRFREELPLVLAGEERRRRLLGGVLQVLPTPKAAQRHG